MRAIGVTAEQAVADLERLKELVRERQAEQWKELELGAVFGGFAVWGVGEGEGGVLDSVAVVGLVESVEEVEAVSELEGGKGRADGGD